jgi:Arginine repressor
MKESRQERLNKLRELLKEYAVSNQEELLNLLKKEGFETTQATLSRDMKALKIVKSPGNNGQYIYTIPGIIPSFAVSTEELLPDGAVSMEFTGNFGVIKTNPGYAGVIALDIDNLHSNAILGTLAGDDTILLIPREGYSREEIMKVLSQLNTTHSN